MTMRFPQRMAHVLVHATSHAGEYDVHSLATGARAHINHTTLAILTLCDGQADEQRIICDMGELFSGDATGIEKHVKGCIDHLATFGAITLADEPSFCDLPPLRVKFIDFWPAFDPLSSVVSRFLCYRYLLIIEQDEEAEADVVFFSDHLPSVSSITRGAHEHTMRVYVPNHGTLYQAPYDYLIAPQPAYGTQNPARLLNIPGSLLYEKSPSNRWLDVDLQKALWDMGGHFSDALNRFTGVENPTPPPDFSQTKLLKQNLETPYAHATLELPKPSEPLAVTGAADAPLVRNLFECHPPRIARKKKPELTIGMLAGEDFDSVYFSVQALCLYHRDVIDEIEIIVIDNAPETPRGEKLSDFILHHTNNVRLIRFNHYTGSSVRDLVFRLAEAEHVLCMDPQVMIAPGALGQLLQFFKENPKSSDLLLGSALEPNSCTQNSQNTLQEIAFFALELFACRREAWVGYNPCLLGNGGDDATIPEKFRRAGGAVRVLPSLRFSRMASHSRPEDNPDNFKHILRNIYISRDEINAETDDIDAVFCAWPEFEATREQVLLELRSSFSLCNAIYAISDPKQPDHWPVFQARLQNGDVISPQRLRRFKQIETGSAEGDIVATHREIIRHAKLMQLENVLVLHDHAKTTNHANFFLKYATAEARKHPWNILHLSGNPEFDIDADKSDMICPLNKERPVAQSCLGVLYNRRVFEQILEGIPETTEHLIPWLEKYTSLNMWLHQKVDNRYLIKPHLVIL